MKPIGGSDCCQKYNDIQRQETTATLFPHRVHGQLNWQSLFDRLGITLTGWPAHPHYCCRKLFVPIFTPNYFVPDILVRADCMYCPWALQAKSSGHYFANPKAWQITAFFVLFEFSSCHRVMKIYVQTILGLIRWKTTSTL